MQETDTVKSSMTVDEFDRMIESIYNYYDLIDSRAEEIKQLNVEVLKLKQKCLVAFKELNRANFISPKGMLYIHKEYQVKVPQNDVQKSVFFDWLRENGIFEKYATVNSNSLKSLVREHYDHMLRNGGDPATDGIPGIEQPTIFEDIRFRRGSKGGST